MTSVKIVLIGQTGTGKCAFGNILCKFMDSNGYSSFQESAGAEFRTRESFGTVKEWGGSKYEIIDTPGLMDSAGTGQDVRNIANIVTYLREKMSVNLFVLVFNEQSSRFDQAMLVAFKAFYDSFGRQMMNNLVFVFTRSTDYLKQEGNQLIRERAAAFYAAAAKKVGDSGNTKGIPGYGVNCHPEDAYPDLKSDNPRRAEFAREDLAAAIEANNLSLRDLLTFAHCTTPLSCGDFQAPEPESELDQLSVKSIPTAPAIVQPHHPGYYSSSKESWMCCGGIFSTAGCRQSSF